MYTNIHVERIADDIAPSCMLSLVGRPSSSLVTDHCVVL